MVHRDPIELRSPNQAYLQVEQLLNDQWYSGKQNIPISSNRIATYYVVWKHWWKVDIQYVSASTKSRRDVVTKQDYLRTMIENVLDCSWTTIEKVDYWARIIFINIESNNNWLLHDCLLVCWRAWPWYEERPRMFEMFLESATNSKNECNIRNLAGRNQVWASMRLTLKCYQWSN